MYFLGVIIVIFVVSLFLAYQSLRQVTKIEEVGEVKRDLKKGKILFYVGHSSSSGEESSSSSS